MLLDAWARLVTEEVRQRLPDVLATQRGQTITWTLGTAVATLDAVAPAWWLRTGKALTYRERLDRDTAHVAAVNIVAHFTP